MLSISLSIGPVNTQLQSDERLSFDAIETLLNRASITTLTMFNAHLGAVVKYENYDNDIECDCEEHNQEAE
ncbi:MAG: hypothetical protein EBX13_05475 [Proteobacteria bacterium]|jgi:hypothetical protein|nr:hypothetical protein [Pseudomonadota bacterium]